MNMITLAARAKPTDDIAIVAGCGCTFCDLGLEVDAEALSKPAHSTPYGPIICRVAASPLTPEDAGER